LNLEAYRMGALYGEIAARSNAIAVLAGA